MAVDYLGFLPPMTAKNKMGTKFSHPSALGKNAESHVRIESQKFSSQDHNIRLANRIRRDSPPRRFLGWLEATVVLYQEWNVRVGIVH